jgi:hypothetical protein
MAVRYVIGTKVRETAKATLVRVINFIDTLGWEHEREVWLPKSQIEVYRQYTDGDCATVWRVPLWLVTKNNIPTVRKAVVDRMA